MPADSANTGALLKQVYGDLADPLAPEDSFARDVKFMTGKKIGREYYWPVRLGLELGVSFSLTHNAYALGPAVDAIYEDAIASGAEITVRSQISYGQMSTLSESKGDSAKAYDQGVAIKILGMTQGHELFREMQLWYGPGSAATPVGNIGVVAATGVSGTPLAGQFYMTISRGTWVPGFWQNYMNGYLDIYNGSAKINVTGPMQVVGVDTSKCRITLTGAAGDITLLANNAAGVVGAKVEFVGAVGNSMLGVEPIALTVGSVFGISNTTFPQWKMINFPVTGALTFDTVTGALSVAADNGLKRGGKLYLCNRSWTDLLNDEVALRRYFGDDMGNKAAPGFKELEFITAVGVCTIRPYMYMKQGNAAFIPSDCWHRIGSNDISATLPGNSSEFFFLQLPANNGAELRTYSDQCIIADYMYTSIWFTGIENTNDSLPSLV